MGILSNLFNAGVNAYSVSTQKNIADQNLEYQKEFNKQIFEREDNAVQRRAADLEAAGLSKTLAAGDAAKAGGTSSAPSIDNSWAKSLQNVKMETDLLQQYSSLYLASKDAEIKEAQKAQIEAQIGHIGAQIANLNANTNNLYYTGLVNKHDWDIISKYPEILSKNQSDWRYQIFGFAKPYLDKAFDYLFNKNSVFKSGVDAIVDAVNTYLQSKQGLAGHLNESFTEKYGSSPADSNFFEMLDDVSNDVKFQLQYPHLKNDSSAIKSTLKEFGYAQSMSK